jgi:hypothetical protein
MDVAVNLDEEPGAQEIGNITADGMLSAEFEIARSPAERLPKYDLR